MRAAALPPGELVIERARLAGNGGRGALEAALAHVRVGDVAGGEEILLIPRLRAREPLSPLRSPGDFGDRLTAQLRALRHGATLDPAGPVAGAAALRFTSKARYAAWLVALWLHPRSGDEAGRALPESSAIRGWVAREVLRDGPVLVATAARLTRQRLLSAWIARFDPTELTLAAAALERAYGVPAIAGVTEARSAPRPPRPLRTAAGRYRRKEAPYRAAVGPGTDLGAAGIGTGRLLRAAWTETLAAEPAAAVLTPAHARLAQALAVLAVHPNLGRLLAPAALERARVAAAGPGGEPGSSAGGPVTEPERRSRLDRKPRLPGDSAPGPGLQPLRPVPAAGSSRSVSRAEPTAAREKSQPALHGPDAPLQHEPASVLPRTLAPPPAAFVTEFAGVFFVVNVLLALGLYPDFTRPRDPGLAPSPFWLLDRLAERLLGGAYRRDPLHRWLAGVGLPGRLPAAWEADPRWLAGLPPAVHGLRGSRARTILWDSRGFALVDEPGVAPGRRRARIRRYAACGPRIELPPQPRRRLPRDPDARWIACLAEFVAVRLALAGDGLGPDSLRLPGSVTVDEERVEVRFDLDRLPIAIRLAGLDRDPGWLPAEGRSLVFKFQ